MEENIFYLLRIFITDLNHINQIGHIILPDSNNNPGYIKFVPQTKGSNYKLFGTFQYCMRRETIDYQISYSGTHRNVNNIFCCKPLIY